jgi:hypothetical protein
MQSLSKIILEMMKVDQDARKAAYKAQMAGEDASALQRIVYVVDAVHNQRIHQLISKHGYLTKKSVGAKALKAFWLLVQHQDFDIDLQRACLEHCGFEPKEKAYLTDRVLVGEGKKQLFGTQFTKKNGRSVPRPIEDKKNLEKRRRQYGLGSFSEYAASMRKTNSMKKRSKKSRVHKKV